VKPTKSATGNATEAGSDSDGVRSGETRIPPTRRNQFRAAATAAFRSLGLQDGSRAAQQAEESTPFKRAARAVTLRPFAPLLLARAWLARADKRTAAQIRQTAAAGQRAQRDGERREAARLFELNRQDKEGRRERGRQRYEAAREQDRIFWLAEQHSHDEPPRPAAPPRGGSTRRARRL
jgi:hypothetical protein